MAIGYTPAAEADLIEIIDYGIDHDQPDPVAYVQTLRARFATLDSNLVPGRSGRLPGTREWVVTGTPYIVVFVRVGGNVNVWRVLHGSQQWPSK